MPSNVCNPTIVASYTAEGGLCGSFTGTNFLCVTNAADTAAPAMQFLAPLDGVLVPDDIIDIWATTIPGTAGVQDVGGGRIRARQSRAA